MSISRNVFFSPYSTMECNTRGKSEGILRKWLKEIKKICDIKKIVISKGAQYVRYI